MSTDKNSPVVESTVVKGNQATNDKKSAPSQTKTASSDTTSTQSIADLKQSAVAANTSNTQSDEQAQKKAKIKDDLAAEAKAKKAEESNEFDTAAAPKTAPKTAAKTDNKTDTKAEDKPADTSKTETAVKAKAAAADSDKTETANTATKAKEATQKTTSDKPAASSKKKAVTKLSAGQHRVAVLGGNRIPFARSNGPYSDVSNTDMLTAALNGLIERYNLQDKQLGEVVAGAVMKLSRDINLTRESVLNTALDPHTPSYDISQACGTGLQATFASANKIALGIIDSAIIGGVDTTSDAPIAIGDGLRKVIIKLGAAKTNKQRLQALMGLNPKDLIDAPQNGEPRTGLSMGDHQAITTLEWNISREDQDDLAFKSHQNLARAYEDGFFDDLITPYKGLTRDNNLRPDTTLEKLAKLKPVFGKKNANPTMTAANSTPLTDGASCVLLGTDEWAKEHGLKPLAYITHQETAAVDFIGKSGNTEGLLMAPAYAVPRMLERAGLTLQDFDFYEIHEAFASQVLSTLAAWEDESFCQERLGLDAPLGSIDRSKLNVNGSSLAAGHPFAATGGRILATAAKLLDQKGSGRALISICAAGGQGVTCILEK